MARLINGKQTDLDGLSVARILPYARQRTVGPFIVFDSMKPAGWRVQRFPLVDGDCREFTSLPMRPAS